LEKSKKLAILPGEPPDDSPRFLQTKKIGFFGKCGKVAIAHGEPHQTDLESKSKNLEEKLYHQREPRRIDVDRCKIDVDRCCCGEPRHGIRVRFYSSVKNIRKHFLFPVKTIVSFIISRSQA